MLELIGGIIGAFLGVKIAFLMLERDDKKERLSGSSNEKNYIYQNEINL